MFEEHLWHLPETEISSTGMSELNSNDAVAPHLHVKFLLIVTTKPPTKKSEDALKIVAFSESHFVYLSCMLQQFFEPLNAFSKCCFLKLLCFLF